MTLCQSTLLAISVVTGSAQAGGDAPDPWSLFQELRAPEQVLPCDTWVALPDATGSGNTILAKNSDRPLFDCQPLLLHPRAQWPEGSTIDLGRLPVPQVEETFATLGSSPYWCWGYEEGINEFGVAIGNEGVWSRVLAADVAAFRRGEGPDLGPTGMDLLRMGLERGRTAREALDVMTALLEEYGQFGSGIPLATADVGGYDNSFILADPDEAWVLETAGRYWVARRFDSGTTSISNTLSIGTEWDLAAPDLVENAVQHGWWAGGADDPFDFARAYLDPAPDRRAQTVRAQTRARCSANLLLERQGSITPWWMMRIARDRSSSPSIDLDQTASSCVAVLPPGDDVLPVFWWCPSTPSNSCYVPFFVHGGALPEVVSTAGKVGLKVAAPSTVAADNHAPDSYWWVFRALSDRARLQYDERNPVIREVFDPLEREFAAEFIAAMEEAMPMRDAGKHDEMRELLDATSARCVERALAAALDLLERFEGEVIPVPGHFQPFVGQYHATHRETTVEVLVQNDRLAVQLPDQGVFELKDPDAEGLRKFVLSDQAAVTFEADGLGAVTAMKLHQGGLIFEMLRDGVEPVAEIPLEDLEEYLGRYHHEQSGVDVEVMVQNHRLAINWPGQMIFELYSPDDKERWGFRVGIPVAVGFDRDPDEFVESMTIYRGGVKNETLQRVDDGGS